MPSQGSHLKSALAGQLWGQVLAPGDPGFDEARSVWNGRFHRKPALIARCEGAVDVSTCIRFAQEHGLRLSVKGGGHDYAGNTVAEGSLLLDLGAMREVEVYPSVMRARIGAGCTWRDVDEATAVHGLAAPGGTVSSVGVSGYTLGGGAGWLARKYGLAVDSLRSAEVVTSDGEILTASDEENPDLFWALRGGGGNFGVVTRFDLELHPVPTDILSGQIMYPAEQAGDLLRFYRDLFLEAPDEVICYPFLMRVPPMDAFPSAWHGKLALDLVVAYVGHPDDGVGHLAVFRELGDPIFEHVEPQPYPQLQRSFDAAMGGGNRWYSRAQQFDALTDEAIDTLVEHLDPFPGEFTSVYLAPGGGAAGRVPPGATAFPHRTSAHELHIFPGWVDPAEDEGIIAWADALHEALLPHGNGSVYVNLLGDGEEARVPDAYRKNWKRLRKAKARWDPDNIFRGNHNIPPAD